MSTQASNCPHVKGELLVPLLPPINKAEMQKLRITIRGCLTTAGTRRPFMVPLMKVELGARVRPGVKRLQHVSRGSDITVFG